MVHADILVPRVGAGSKLCPKEQKMSFSERKRWRKGGKGGEEKTSRDEETEVGGGANASEQTQKSLSGWNYKL